MPLGLFNICELALEDYEAGRRLSPLVVRSPPSGRPSVAPAAPSGKGSSGVARPVGSYPAVVALLWWGEAPSRSSRRPQDRNGPPGLAVALSSSWSSFSDSQGTSLGSLWPPPPGHPLRRQCRFASMAPPGQASLRLDQTG